MAKRVGWWLKRLAIVLAVLLVAAGITVAWLVWSVRGLVDREDIDTIAPAAQAQAARFGDDEFLTYQVWAGELMVGTIAWHTGRDAAGALTLSVHAKTVPGAFAGLVTVDNLIQTTWDADGLPQRYSVTINEGDYRRGDAFRRETHAAGGDSAVGAAVESGASGESGSAGDQAWMYQRTRVAEDGSTSLDPWIIHPAPPDAVDSLTWLGAWRQQPPQPGERRWLLSRRGASVVEVSHVAPASWPYGSGGERPAWRVTLAFERERDGQAQRVSLATMALMVDRTTGVLLGGEVTEVPVVAQLRVVLAEASGIAGW